MVRGLDLFKEYFREYTDQYVLIGGAACSISFAEQELDFGRITKDLDVVLIVEILTKDFANAFWKFIRDGQYQIRAKSNNKPCFYRFDRPKDERFPKMIELFSRGNCLTTSKNVSTPIHIDDSVSSLSAILLNDAYYSALVNGRKMIMGISVLQPELIIPFKAKAWLDLRNKIGVDSADIKKHKNDIVRIASEMLLERTELSWEIKNDMSTFIEEFDITQAELKNLKIQGIGIEEIKRILTETYL